MDVVGVLLGRRGYNVVVVVVAVVVVVDVSKTGEGRGVEGFGSVQPMMLYCRPVVGGDDSARLLHSGDPVAGPGGVYHLDPSLHAAEAAPQAYSGLSAQ